MNKKIVLTLGVLITAISFSVFAVKKKEKKSSTVPTEIQWITVPELEQKMKKEPRKIIFDFYTSWCGWCKVMDKKTYSNKELAQYVNKNYYAVKFDAESKEPVTYMGKTYNFKPEYKANEFAVQMMNGQMSYPTTVIAAPDMSYVNPIPGYQRVDQMETLLKFFVANPTPSQELWTNFARDFKPSWTPDPSAE